MKKKIAIYTAIVLVLLVVAFGGLTVYSRSTAQGGMKVDVPVDNLGVMPLSLDNTVELAPGLRFRIDTGTSSNTISPEYIELLRKYGCEVDSSVNIKLTRTSLGKYRVDTKRYTVQLPVHSSTIVSDSTGKRLSAQVDPDNRINTLSNVDFIPTSKGEMPRIGMQVLKRFYVEFMFKEHAIRLWNEMPEEYEEVGGLSHDKNLFWEGKRYLTLSVNGNEQRFFINTSMPRVSLLLPLEKATQIDRETVFRDTVPSIFGPLPGVIDYKVWVDWGKRGGNGVGFYTNYGRDDYAVNPFFFLSQDAVFDFGSDRVFLHPVSQRVIRNRSNDVFASNQDSK